MPTPHDPYKAEPDDHLATEPLDDGEGGVYRVAQEPVGTDRVIGGGEFPDPRTPARAPAPGSAGHPGEPDDTGLESDGSGDAVPEADEESGPWPSSS